ncbi:MAG: 50S ribosomal protein L31e [Candidatus Bilamarchaeaceae archaeon]
MDKFERVYNVPLGDAYLTTRVKATRRAVKILKEFIKRHAKVDVESVKLSNKLNAFVWSRGRKKPPRHVKIKVIKDGGVARAYLHDEKIEEKKKEEKKSEEKKPEETKQTEKETVEGEVKEVEGMKDKKTVENKEEVGKKEVNKIGKKPKKDEKKSGE